MKSKQRHNRARMAAYNASKAAVANKDSILERNIAAALVGSAKVAKALSLIDYKACPRPVRETSEGGAMCIPQVALFAAGHRKSETVTAR